MARFKSTVQKEISDVEHDNCYLLHPFLRWYRGLRPGNDAEEQRDDGQEERHEKRYDGKDGNSERRLHYEKERTKSCNVICQKAITTSTQQQSETPFLTLRNMKAFTTKTVYAFAALTLASGLLQKSRIEAYSTAEEPSSMVGKRAPEISQGRWINSQPLKLSGLRGKVVLLEFWTYGCYNCRNTIPHLNEWYKKYGGREFEIIGVHTPEFATEKEFSRVESQTAALAIHYPVVTDNTMKTWSIYHQEYWPVLYLIDKDGIIRFAHVGEGSYQETERMMRTLIGLD